MRLAPITSVVIRSKRLRPSIAFFFSLCSTLYERPTQERATGSLNCELFCSLSDDVFAVAIATAI